MSGPPIPGYTYLQHLGSGGFADVFLYEQAWPQQRVAVKVVRAGVALSEHETSLFTSEANAMARLADHPYIVDVITAGVTDADQGSRPYLVMRYCPPPDLGARVRAQPMSVPDAVAPGSSWPAPSRPPTAPGSSTATSSRRTSWSPPTRSRR